ncbi:MAG TPA: hypothetical protein DIT13_16325 [Verrucomicrobiales bacterium]|nr:hypothetical protein [Verrucomicrobiales bacterium]HRK14991.1 hypothetical protein [Prosthecobacter sp.]
MKKILILLVVLAALVVTAVVYQKQQNATLNTAATSGVKSRELLLPGLDPTAVQKIRIKDSKAEVNVSINEDRKGARLAERGGYSASIERVGRVLNELREQKIASKQIVGKGAWSEIEVQPPGDNAEGVGTQVEIYGAENKLLASFVLGKQLDITGGVSSTSFSGGNQRFIRIPEDGDTIWVVSNTFYDIEAKPESWLDKAFMDVQKIREIAVTGPDEKENWKVGRKDESATDYVLLDAKTGEALDGPKLSVSSLLSTPTFNDVHAKDKAGELLKGATKARITTFDGFAYDVQVAKQSKDGGDKYYLSFTVSADIPQKRPEVKDEKEEDKKKADEEFAAQKKSKEEKLAKEQQFAGWVYEVSEYTINNLFKKRSEIVKVEAKTEEAPAPAVPNAPAPAAPAPSAATPVPKLEVDSKPPSISVTTPPVAVPELPKTEVKPAPDPAANPAAPKQQ